MSLIKARAHFLGKAAPRLNCGQTIMHAFKDKFSLSDDAVAEFAGYGGGMAPEGHCGSFYAAKCILEKNFPDKLKACEETMLHQAGSTKCKQIRAGKKISCLGCVETIAQFLENISLTGEGR